MAYAQDRPKVLIVPFQEISVVTEFDMEELLEINKLSQQQFSRAICDSLIHTLKYETKHIDYTVLPTNEFEGIKHLLYPIHTYDPVPHFGVNIKALNNVGLIKQMANNYNVDYILFLTSYRMTQRLLLANQSFDGSFFLPWSNHLVDYELVDEKGELIALASKLNLEPNTPNQSNYTLKGLALKEMDQGHRILHRDIRSKILLHKKKKGGVIYRLSKKDLKLIKGS